MESYIRMGQQEGQGRGALGKQVNTDSECVYFLAKVARKQYEAGFTRRT